MSLKLYKIFFKEKEDDKYYDVTITSPETKKEIKLMTALDYPEDSKTYKKAVGVKDYLDKNEGKGVEDSEEPIEDTDENSDKLDTALQDVLSSDLDNTKKRSLKDKIKKAEDLRKKLIQYRGTIKKGIQKIESNIQIQSSSDDENASKKKEELETKKEELESLLDDIQNNLDSLDSKIKEFSATLNSIGKKKENCLFTGSSHILHEAIISPKTYLAPIRRILEIYQKDIFNKNIENNLNKYLQNKFMIYFSISSFHKKDLYVLGGQYDSQNNYIYIQLDRKINEETWNKETIKNCIFKLLEIIGHEGIHRIQNQRYKFKNISQKIIKGKEGSENYYRSYFSDKDEIMSYAFQTIEWLRSSGKSFKEISNIIKIEKNRDFKNRGDFTTAIDFYISLFPKENPIRKRFFKYLYEYLTKY